MHLGFASRLTTYDLKLPTVNYCCLLPTPACIQKGLILLKLMFVYLAKELIDCERVEQELIRRNGTL